MDDGAREGTRSGVRKSHHDTCCYVIVYAVLVRRRGRAGRLAVLPVLQQQHFNVVGSCKCPKQQLDMNALTPAPDPSGWETGTP